MTQTTWTMMLLSLGKYTLFHHHYNVQLSRLNKEIDFSAYDGNVSPVCLAQKNDGDFEDVDVTATSWGTMNSRGTVSAVLMEVDLKTITITQCKGSIKELYAKERHHW